MNVLQAISIFLTQDIAPPHLVIVDGDEDELKKYGFRQQGKFWIISKEDARRVLVDSQPKSEPGPDFDLHWKNEMKNRLKNAPI